MADPWRVTYMGEGVKPTPVGAFSKYVTAYVDESFARSVAGKEGWIVVDPSGKETAAVPAAAPAPPPAKKPDEKKPDEKKAEEKKADEKKPEDKKADEKKADEKKPAESGEKKK